MNTKDKTQRFNPSYTAGLTDDEVLLRKKQGLVNEAQEKITKTNGQIIRDNVCTLFNAFNLAIGICLALVGAWTNMFYLLIILLNITIGIYQEMHAKKLVENLSIISALKADVIRNSKECEISVEELVLDDIIVLCAGKQICADSIVINGEVEVNESLLTGEVEPVLKKNGDILLSGSFIVSGKCCAKVENVGTDNFAAKLAHGAKKHKRINSELLRSMRKVTKFTSFFIVPIGIILFIQAYYLRFETLDHSVIYSSAALLGMLPKGLVLLTSITLAAGIIKLSKKKILVQELHCIETLAHVDMLCLDKTGTITEGKMRVSDIYAINDNIMPFSIEQAMSCFVGAMEDNNATFAALKEFFPENHIYKPVSRTPFSSQRGWSGVTFESVGTLILGAPEVLIDYEESLPPNELTEMQKSGKRILCLAYSTEEIINNKLPKVSLTAAIGLSDPIRKNAKEALEFFKTEGVKVKIISGDNPMTVSSIAKQAGLLEYDSYVDLSQIRTEEELYSAAEEFSIFGRVTPNQKRRLIKVFQEKGYTVAMTGDGVNDALALREADCSIAMASGSDAAKQVSQLVLINSDFTSLPDVVMEGRRVVNNISRVAGIFFIKTIYSVLLSIFSVLTSTSFMFIPIQITLIDLVIEAYPSFFMSFEPDHKRIRGTFLESVINRALPFGLVILCGVLIISFLAPVMQISKLEATSIMYYLTGFVSVLALIKANRPFNALRLFLCITSAVGFFAAAYLFAGILSLQPLGTEPLIVLICLAVSSIPLSMLFSYIVNKLFNLYRKIIQNTKKKNLNKQKFSIKHSKDISFEKSAKDDQY